MFKLNLKWNNQNELEIPGGSRFCIEYDDTCVYAMLYGETTTYLGEFDSVKEAKKFCEDYYTLKVLKIVKEL